MHFIIVIFVFFISPICHSLEKPENPKAINSQNIATRTNQLEIKWKEFYTPSKGCRYTYRIKDSKKRSRCKLYQRKARYKFNELNADEISLIDSYIENKANKTNDNIKIKRQHKVIKPIPVPFKYISFKKGGSACPNKDYWKRLSDNLEQGIYTTKEFDKNCFYLRENNVVYGFLDRYIYKDNEYIQVKSSDGKLLWLELAGVEGVASSSNQKPIQWSTNLRTQDGKLISNTLSEKITSNKPKKNRVNTVSHGVRTKGGGIACLSEKWYEEVISNTDINIFNSHIKNKKCLILKKGIPVTLIDTTIFTRRAVFMFQGIKFWSSMENIIME